MSEDSQPQRKQKKRRGRLGDLWELNGKTLEEALFKISNWIGYYGSNAKLEAIADCDQPYDWYGEYETPETDKEMEERLAKATKAEARREAKRKKVEEAELKELARLKEKYGIT